MKIKGILLLLFKYINDLIPKKKTRIIFMSSPDYSDNAKPFFEYLYHNHSSYELIWIVKDNVILDRLLNKRIKVFRNTTFSAAFYMLTSKYIVGTHNDFLSVKSSRQIYINLWHGMPLKKMAFLEDLTNVNNRLLKKFKRNYSRIDYLIATSDIMKLAMASCFFIDPRKVIISGQPRNDVFFRGIDKKWLAEKLGINLEKYSKILFYAPTFKKGLGRVDSTVKENHCLDLNNFNEDALIEYLEKNNYLLLIKLHPLEEQSFTNVNSSNLQLLHSLELSRELITLNEILSVTDLLITDYSSVYFDYLLLNKPILFINTDEDEYRKNRGFIFGDLDIWRPGPKVNTMEDFFNEVTKLFSDKNYFKKERAVLNDWVNKYQDPHSSQRVFEMTLMNTL